MDQFEINLYLKSISLILFGLFSTEALFFFVNLFFTGFSQNSAAASPLSSSSESVAAITCVIDMLLHQVKQNSKPLPKSCSVGMGGFMGRIDDDKIEEYGSVNGGGVKNTAVAADLYPRSKSYAAGKSQVIRVKWSLHAREEIVFELQQHLKGNAARTMLEGIRKSTRDRIRSSS